MSFLKKCNRHAILKNGERVIRFKFCLARDQQETLVFTAEGRRSRRTPSVVISDLDFKDAIALIYDEISRAHELVLSVEKEAAEIVLDPLK